MRLIHDDFDLRRFTAFASSATYFYPGAAPEQMIACSDWCAWLFFLDDLYDENVQASWDATGACRLMAGCLECLRGARPQRSSPPLARFAFQIRERLLATAVGGERWLGRFATSAENYLLKGVLSANAHWAHGVMPAVALINRQTRDLIALQAQLPRRRRRPDLSVARYVAGMGQLLRGNFDWSLATGRYRTARSPFPELRLPG